jgi:peptidase M48-like protein
VKKLLVIFCSAALAVAALRPISAAPSPTKMKLRGYITARPSEQVISILDDQISFTSATRIESRAASGGSSASAADLQPGALIEAEGVWSARHHFTAEKISIDERQLEKQIHSTAYLQEEPLSTGESSVWKADGERLVLDSRTRRGRFDPTAEGSGAVNASAAERPSSDNVSPPGATLAGHQLRYTGVRRSNGDISAESVELGPPAPPDVYKMPHGIEVVRSKDPQTGIDIVQFQRGKKVDGRLKLFPVRVVQEYVSHLGDSLLPAGARGTTHAIEFRFFVIEDSSINAAALPDGTVLVHTGLLGAVENESQLAFVLSHEIAHTLQAHYWREVHETRPQRIGLLIAGIVAGGFIGDIGIFLSELGMISVINGHQRMLENQADRLGLQNVIEHGYDPRQAPWMSRMIIERYGDRTTSKLWSNHDSSVLRGSFLTVQLARQYPEGHFDKTVVDTDAFRAMKEAMGPVKIE